MAPLAEDAPWAGAGSLVFLLFFLGFAWFYSVFVGLPWFSESVVLYNFLGFLGFQSLWFSTSGSLDSSLTVF